MKGRSGAIFLAALWAAAPAACGSKAPQSRELEPGVHEIKNSQGRFVFLDDDAPARKAGAGLGLRIVKEEGGLRIVDVAGGGPADAAGFKAGDVIEAIDGKPAAALPLEAAAGMIRGKPGSPVALVVRTRSGRAEKTLRRDRRLIRFIEHPRGAAPMGLPEAAFGGKCPVEKDRCLFLIRSGGICYFGCPAGKG